jgi:hypothetical protein
VINSKRQLAGQVVVNKKITGALERTGNIHSGPTGEEIRLLQQILYVLYLLEKAVNTH